MRLVIWGASRSLWRHCNVYRKRSRVMKSPYFVAVDAYRIHSVHSRSERCGTVSSFGRHRNTYESYFAASRTSIGKSNWLSAILSHGVLLAGHKNNSQSEGMLEKNRRENRDLLHKYSKLIPRNSTYIAFADTTTTYKIVNFDRHIFLKWHSAIFGLDNFQSVRQISYP